MIRRYHAAFQHTGVIEHVFLLSEPLSPNRCENQYKFTMLFSQLVSEVRDASNT